MPSNDLSPFTPSSSSGSLLLVEDDAFLGPSLRDYLTHAGFSVTWVTSIRAAEKALASPFDLLLTDLRLPDGSGGELCIRVRPRIRSGIVVCTGYCERSLKLRLLHSGVDAFLDKPLDPEELLAVLSSVQRRTSPAASPMLPSTAPNAPWRLDRMQLSLLSPNGKSISLSQAEGLFIAALLNQADRFMARSDLQAAFANQNIEMTGPRLETLVSRLRTKVYREGGLRLPVRAWYGRGYAFNAQAAIA